jgi:UDP-GlcNAc:undecaprenyl-phosphate GlcNAc-1-phosphate transferase
VGAVWTQKSATLLAITAPVIALAVPILDTGLAIVRRFLRRSPIFGADRGHIHHRLLDSGLTPRRAVLLLYGCSAAAAALALVVAHVRDGRVGALGLVAFCAAAALAVQRLRYPEFAAVRRIWQRGLLREALRVDVNLERLAGRLAAAEDAEQYWGEVREACRELGFRDARLTVGSLVYRDPWPVSADCWSVYAPLNTRGDSIQLARDFGSPAPSAVVGPFLELLRRHPIPPRPAREEEEEEAA